MEVTILAIEHPAPGATIQPNAPIVGHGWVVSESEIESIALYLDGRFCGFATYGAFRPDVLERFPTYKQADQSGINFAIAAPPRSEEAPELIVVARTISGRETRRVIPLRIADPAASAVLSAASALWPIRIAVEQARLDDAGLLRVAGWVASRAPLYQVRLHLGDVDLGVPEVGLARPDVALLHPEYPNAAHAGFRLVQQLETSKLAQPLLRVQAICDNGAKRQVITPVERPSLPAARASATGGAIQFCCDLAAIDSGGNITVSGWAIAPSGIVAIDVQLDGEPIGQATLGVPRPDVGNRFPQTAAARDAGFNFSHVLSHPFDGEHTITLSVRDAGGAEQIIPLPLQPRDGAWFDATFGRQAAAIRFNIEQPTLDGDRARDAAGAMLTISGWAIAAAGIDFIEASVDGIPLGRAYYGTRRPDIAAALPDLPDALLSGFTLHATTRFIATGERTVSVQCHAKSGETTERSFSIMFATSLEPAPWETIRAIIGQVEIDYGLAILGRHETRYFEVHIWLPDRAETSLALARDTMVSLQKQAYPHWRAILCGAKAARIPKSFAAGSAVGMQVSGAAKPWPAKSAAQTFVLRLRAGDRLGADALLEFAMRAALNPADDLIYSDDRRANPSTSEAAPFFKPDWSPDLLLSFNYIGRAWCATKTIAKAAGLTGGLLDTAGDYDCVMRLTERARNVGHVSRILIDASAAAAADPMDEPALAAAISRRRLQASLLPGRAPAGFRVAREITEPGRVSVIIPTIFARNLIRITIDGLRRGTDWPDIEIICIDNMPPGRNRREKAWLRKSADRVIELYDTFNWSRFNNTGAAAATGAYLLFLNDDIEITQPDWLSILVSHAQRPEIGVVGPQLLYPDGKVQQAGIFLTQTGGRHNFRFAAADEPGPFGLALSERNVIAVTGACMLVRRDAFAAAGGFNETHSVINNDVDYCLRARRAGQRVLFTPHATLIHHELASRAELPDDYNRAEFHGEWATLLRTGDPFFNPNLSQHSDLWSPEPEPVEIIHAGHPLVARHRVRRILAVKLDHIGDFITALPALRRLKQRFPGAELHLLAAAASVALAASEPCIDATIQFDFFHARSGKGQRGIADPELIDLRARLLPYQFDIAVDLRLQPDTRHVLQYTGAAILAGFTHDVPMPWLDIPLPWEGDEKLLPKHHHVSDRLTQLAETVSIACEAAALATRPPAPDAKSRIAAMPAFVAMPPSFLSGLVICIHPGAGSDTKQWPVSYFAALIDLLVEQHGARIILVGAPEEAPVADDLLGLIASATSIFSVVGKTSLPELLSILCACDMFIGNDSGPKHLAAALGVATIGLHSAVVDAHEWGPAGTAAVALRRSVYCGPCYIAAAIECPRSLACLTGLLPADAYRACVRMLPRNKEAVLF